MITTTKYLTSLLLSLFVMGGSVLAQQSRDLQYFRSPDKTGVNQFEAPFTTNISFDGVVVRLGGANTLQFQGLSQENAITNPADPNYLPELGSNFNLATSNLDFDVQLDNGLRMHLKTYLSSQHHPEAWVKGGYLQIDRLDFISKDFMADFMENIRVKVGHMELNYGDAHFRRTDNGQAIHNPFVGNYIMDSFTTEVGGEVYYHSNGFLAMLGLSNGRLNQNVVKSTPETKAYFYGKLGYDSQISDDLRFRLTGSVLSTPETARINMYSGDRAGSRYYNVMNGGFRSGRFAPDFTGANPGKMTAIMINPFVKYQGLEFFGVIETVSGKQSIESENRSFTQIGTELLYRFGTSEDVYVGARYNTVSGELISNNNIDINRINIGGGWFMTKNVLAKLEFVSQTYNGFPAGSVLQDGKFNGFMIEAVVAF